MVANSERERERKTEKERQRVSERADGSYGEKEVQRGRRGPFGNDLSAQTPRML